MSDLTPEEQAAFEKELKLELIDKLAKVGITADLRYSVAKLEEMLGNAALEQPNPPTTNGPDDAIGNTELDVANAQIAELKLMVEQLIAERSAPPAPPPPEVPPAIGPDLAADEPAPANEDATPTKVRITKMGDGKVHDGRGGTFKWNDEPTLLRSVAEALESRGFAEIQ